jgi:N-methylhydantoinase A
VARHARLRPTDLAIVLDALHAQASAALAREGFDRHERQFVRSADLRYYGQAFEVRVDLPDGDVTQQLVDGVASAFHAEHRALYGYDFRHDPAQEVEWVNIRVTGVGPIRKPEVRTVPRGAHGPASGTRPVYFDGWVDAAVYDRSQLGAGDVIVGPAVIEEFGSTVPVDPGFSAHVDPYGNLVLRRRTHDAGTPR